MTRRRWNVPLPLRLMWRRLRSPEGRLAPLAALSIAVSVALATGLEMSSRSAQVQLERTADAMTGAAKIEVTAGRVGLDESVLEIVRGEDGVLAASPLLSTRLRLVNQTFVLNIVGVDFLTEQEVRTTSINRRGVKIRDPLSLIANPKAVIVTPELLDRVGLARAWAQGQDVGIPVRTENGTSTLVVQGVLEGGGIAAAFGGQVAVMDIYALQALVSRESWFDRIDVVPAPGVPVPKLVTSLGERLRGIATVQQSSTHTGEIDEAIELVRIAALVIAGAGALAACLLAYASTAQWVDRQRKYLATLRAVGMEAHRVQLGVFQEIAVLALLGTLIGTPAGITLAPTMLATLSKFALTAGGERLTTLSVQPSTIAIAFLVGGLAAAAGGVVPARRAGRRFTLDALDNEFFTTRKSQLWRLALASFLAAATSAWALSPSAFSGAAVVRIVVIFAGGLGAIFSAAPLLLRLIAQVLGPLRRLSPSLGHLVTRSYAMRPWSFAVAVTAISSLIAALTAVFLLIETVNAAVESWTRAGSPGGIQVLPESLADTTRFEVLSPDTIRTIRQTPEVKAVDERYMGMASIMFRGTEVDLLARSMPVVAEYGYIPSVGRSSRDLALDLSTGGVAVSTGFAKRFGFLNQRQIELDTRDGSKTFLIKGMFEDFGGPAGSILLDLKTFDSHWSRSGASSAVIWPARSRAEMIDAVRERVGDSQYLFFADTNDIEKFNREITNVFARVLRSIAAFVASLGGLAVAMLLFGVLAERKRDFALLRAAGAAPRQLALLLLGDAVAVGLSASLSGLTLGLVCAAPTTDVLRESYGWALDQHWSAPELPFVAIGSVFAAALASVAPACVAYRSLPANVFTPE